MEFTAEDAKALIRAAWAVLSSPLAQRVYVLLIGAGILLVSLLSAKTGIRLVDDQKAKTHKSLRALRMGTPPDTRPKLTVKIGKLVSRYLLGLLAAIPGLLVSLVCGVAIPAIVLFAMLFAYRWFDPLVPHLLDVAGQPVERLDLVSASWLLADQTLRGGLFDLIEIFALEVTPITNNPANIPFSMGLFAYHLYVESFVSAGFAIWGYNAWSLWRTLMEEVRYQRGRYADAEAKRATPIELALKQGDTQDLAPVGSAAAPG